MEKRSSNNSKQPMPPRCTTIIPAAILQSIYNHFLKLLKKCSCIEKYPRAFSILRSNYYHFQQFIVHHFSFYFYIVLENLHHYDRSYKSQAKSKRDKQRAQSPRNHQNKTYHQQNADIDIDSPADHNTSHVTSKYQQNITTYKENHNSNEKMSKYEALKIDVYRKVAREMKAKQLFKKGPSCVKHKLDIDLDKYIAYLVLTDPIFDGSAFEIKDQRIIVNNVEFKYDYSCFPCRLFYNSDARTLLLPKIKHVYKYMTFLDSLYFGNASICNHGNDSDIKTDEKDNEKKIFKHKHEKYRTLWEYNPNNSKTYGKHKALFKFREAYNNINNYRYWGVAPIFNSRKAKNLEMTITKIKMFLVIQHMSKIVAKENERNGKKHENSKSKKKNSI